jgi:hypothetical protein
MVASIRTGMLVVLMYGAAVVTGAQTHAADGAPAAEVESIDIGRYLPEGLRKTFDRDIDGMALETFLQVVGETTGIEVYTEWDKLREATVTPEALISIRAKDVPAHLVLNRAFANINGVRLDWNLHGSLIRVSTEDDDAPVTLEVMNVGDLVTDPASASGLLKALVEMTPAKWRSEDGGRRRGNRRPAFAGASDSVGLAANSLSAGRAPKRATAG